MEQVNRTNYSQCSGSDTRSVETESCFERSTSPIAQIDPMKWKTKNRRDASHPICQSQVLRLSSVKLTGPGMSFRVSSELRASAYAAPRTCQ